MGKILRVNRLASEAAKLDRGARGRVFNAYEAIPGHRGVL